MKYLLSILIAFVVIFSSSLSKAENSLPEPMVGQTTVMINPGADNQRVFYDGMGSNEVILTTDPNVTLGYNLTNIQNCRGSLSGVFSLPNLVRCFILDPATDSGIKNLTSRSSRDGNQEVEISALIYSPGIIQGDAFSDFSSSNFAFYGRNLNQNHNNTHNPSNGSWNTGVYSFNPEAQSSFSGEQAQYIKNRVMALANEANTVTAAALNTNGDWYLQGSSITDISNSDAGKYPEGKVWIVTQDLSLDTTVGVQRRYHGKGTIIFMKEASNPSLVLQSGVQIVPGNKGADSLGVIIGKKSGNSIEDASATLEFQGINTLAAATLVFGSIKKSLPGSVEAIGSFVADSFDGFTATNGFTRFVYDYKYEQNWPPGFRYFNMPQASNSSPN